MHYLFRYSGNSYLTNDQKLLENTSDTAFTTWWTKQLESKHLIERKCRELDQKFGSLRGMYLRYSQMFHVPEYNIMYCENHKVGTNINSRAWGIAHTISLFLYFFMLNFFQITN